MLRRRTRVSVATLAALAMLVAAPVAARADTLPPAVQSVVDDFRSDGEITPCKHTVEALEETSKLSPADVAQLSPDFPPAVSAALEARKSKKCGSDKQDSAAAAAAPSPTVTPTPAAGASPAATASPKAAPSSTATAAPKATPSATPQVTPAPTATAPPPVATATPAPPVVATVGRDDPFPLGLWILAGLLAAVLLVWLALAALGRLGWGEERLAGPRHAWAEARYRAGGVWSDFTDWLRLGR